MTYEYPNSYFKLSDPRIEIMNGFQIPSGWWSRHYEYQFAMCHAAAGQIVADMGCGWNYRPLHDWLSATCEFTYGVDHHVEVLELPPMQRGTFVVADFFQRIEGIPAHSLDRIFCISVLEELIDTEKALAEFKRLLKPTGRMIITMDAPYKADRPAHEKYKGVQLEEFERAMWNVGLSYDGSVKRVIPEDALYNDDFNLCVWHCVLKFRPEIKPGDA